MSEKNVIAGTIGPKRGVRMPDEGEDLTGKVCACSVGRPAVVIGRRHFDFGDAWIGLGLDGKGTWASTRPCVLAESCQEFHDRLLDRFGGKMARNG